MLEIELLTNYLNGIKKFMKKGLKIVFRGENDSALSFLKPPYKNTEEHIEFYKEKFVDFLDDLKDVNFKDSTFIKFSKNVLQSLYDASQECKVDLSLDDVKEIIEKGGFSPEEKINEISKIVGSKKKELDGALYIVYLEDYNLFRKLDFKGDTKIEDFILSLKNDKFEYIEDEFNVYFVWKEDLIKTIQKKIIIKSKDKKGLKETLARLLNLEYSSSMQDDERIFMEGKKLEHDGDLDGAIKKYQEAQKEGFEEDEILYNMGRVHHLKNDYENAILCFEKIENKEDYRLDYMLLDSYFKTQRYERCFDYYFSIKDSSLDANIASFEDKLKSVYYHMFEKAMENNDDSSLKEAFEKLKTIESNSELSLKLANKKEEQGRLKEALDIIKEALSHEEDFSLYMREAHLEFELSNYDAALESYNKALGFHLKEDEVYVGIASIFSAKKELGKAIEVLEKAVSLNEKNPIVYYTKGDVHFEIKEYEKALSDYENAIELGIDTNDVYYKRAKTYEALGQKIDALKDYQKVIEKSPSHILSSMRKAYLEFELEKFSDAKDSFEFLINHPNATKYFSEDKIIEFHQIHAECCKKLKLLQFAMEDYEYIVSIKEDFDALKNLAEIYSIFEEKDRAIDIYKKLFEKENKDEYLYSISLLYKELDLDLSMDFINRAIMKNSNKKEYYLLRGELRKNLRRYSEAIMDFDKAITIDENYSQAYILRGTCKKEIGNTKDAFEDFKRANIED